MNEQSEHNQKAGEHMGRIAIFEKDAVTNGWYGRWQGRPRLLGPYLMLRNCYIDFAASFNITPAEFDDRSLWKAEQLTPDLWQLTEVDVAPSATTPARTPRQAKFEYVAPLWIGWWTDRPDHKVEDPLLDDCLRRLAPLIGQPESEFHIAVVRELGWKFTFAGTSCELLEVFPDATATPCPDCAHTDHPGKYLGLRGVEDCATCRGKAVLP